MDLEAIHKHLIQCEQSLWFSAFKLQLVFYSILFKCAFALTVVCAPTQLPAPSELQSCFDELSGALNRLIEVEGDVTPSVSASDNRLQLLDELRQSVAKADGGFIGDFIGFASFPAEGMGLRAECDVKAGQLLLKVPRCAMLTHEAAMSCQEWSSYQLAADPLCSRMPNACLALYLLHHRCLGAASPHAAYVRCLPGTFSNCLNFDASAFRCLGGGGGGGATRERVLVELRNACRQYLYFYRLLLTPGRGAPGELAASLPLMAPGSFTYAGYRWAVSAVMSRNNAVPRADGGGGGTLALIPLWDMGNHRFGQLSTDFSPEDQCLIFYAMEDARAGSQVYFMYGARSNADYLLYSGFAVGGENPHDTADLRLGLNPRDRLIEEKTRCLDGMGVMNRSHTFHLPMTNPLTPQVLAFGRVMCAQTAAEVASAAVPVSGGDLNRRAGVYLANRCRLLSSSAAAAAADSPTASAAAAVECCRFVEGERTKFAKLADALQRWADAEAGVTS